MAGNNNMSNIIYGWVNMTRLYSYYTHLMLTECALLIVNALSNSDSMRFHRMISQNSETIYAMSLYAGI